MINRHAGLVIQKKFHTYS